MQQRDHQPRPRRAQRMPQRDRAAIHVHLLAIQSQFFFYRQILRRERLVRFNQVDILELQSRPSSAPLATRAPDPIP